MPLSETDFITSILLSILCTRTSSARDGFRIRNKAISMMMYQPEAKSFLRNKAFHFGRWQENAYHLIGCGIFLNIYPFLTEVKGDCWSFLLKIELLPIGVARGRKWMPLPAADGERQGASITLEILRQFSGVCHGRFR